MTISRAREFMDRVEAQVTFGDICGDDAWSRPYGAAAIPRSDKPYVFVSEPTAHPVDQRALATSEKA